MEWLDYATGTFVTSVCRYEKVKESVAAAVAVGPQVCVCMRVYWSILDPVVWTKRQP